MTQIMMKDVPWKEISHHFYSAPPEAEQIWESQIRGKIMELTGERHYYHFLQKDNSNIHVTGYETTFIIPESNGKFWACEICAEIGD